MAIPLVSPSSSALTISSALSPQPRNNSFHRTNSINNPAPAGLSFKCSQNLPLAAGTEAHSSKSTCSQLLAPNTAHHRHNAGRLARGIHPNSRNSVRTCHCHSERPSRKFKIQTLATNIAVRNVALLGAGLLLLNYVGAITTAILTPQGFRCSFMIPAHAILALCLIFQVWVLEQNNYTKEANTAFYLFIWKLFYAEFIVFPFI